MTERLMMNIVRVLGLGSVCMFVCVYVWDEVEESEAE